jgi:RNA polymerase sigma-70 factor (ECF subfamily)
LNLRVPPESQTLLLLKRWHAGERAALDTLLERDMPWIKEHVSRRLGPALRTRLESGDVVQETMLQVLRYGPRFLLSDMDQFRALLARMVENVIRMQARRLQQERRDAQREQQLPSDSVLLLDRSSQRPSQIAAKDESAAWMQLGIELLDPDDKDVLMLRQWDGLSFGDVGERLGIAEDAARMRFQRALGRLARLVQRLRAGELQKVLAEGGAR